MADPKRLVISNHQAPGDLLMLTCAIRDLHRLHPGKYITEVRSSLQDIFRGNPYVAPSSGQGGIALRAGYTRSVNQSNQRCAHFATGFVQHLSEMLQTRIRLTELRPDVHLSEAEKDRAKLPPELRGRPYWVIVSGGKDQFTAKVWDPCKWQRVVDALRGEVQFVQIGKLEKKHRHPPLGGVINMLGKTSFRELMVLCYHAQGAACCVTSVMHLMAAFNRACVVVDGGREPWWWEAYNRQTWVTNSLYEVPSDLVEHRYLHTMGALDCCLDKGCWKSGVGDKKGSNCVHVVRVGKVPQPQCLTMITPEQVAAEIRSVLRGEPAPRLPLPARLKPPLFLEPLPTSGGVVKKVPRTVPAVVKQAMRRITRARPVVMTSKATGLYAVDLEQYALNGVDTELPVTVCVMLQGDCVLQAQRCLGGVYQTIPTSLFELRVGFYGATPAVHEWTRRVVTPRGNLRVYSADRGSGYYSLMRRLVHEPVLATKWSFWFEGTGYPANSTWLLKYLLQARNARAGLVGRKLFYHVRPGQPDWVASAAWYRGRAFEKHEGKDVFNYVGKEAWLVRNSVLLDAGWPDLRLHDTAGDIMLGAMMTQMDASIKSFTYGIQR